MTKRKHKGDAGEKEHAINGVPGRLFWGAVPGAALYTTQRWVSPARDITDGEYKGYRIRAEIRFDDSCRNGHMSFGITGSIFDPKYREGSQRGEVAGGCLHEAIAAAFPELAPLIKWHLCSTDGPMHYIANTLYHAGDRDCHGLRKGERRQIINGRTGEPAWHLVWIDGGVEKPLYDMPKQRDGVKPAQNPVVEWRPWCREGEGKERELAYARSSAVWPEATDAELCAEPAELRAKLEARLPALIAAMRADMEAAGLDWVEPEAAQ